MAENEFRWLPMDMAPRDGRYVVVWHPEWLNREPLVAHWEVNERDTDGGYWVSQNDTLSYPTHWAALPDLPAERKEPR